MKLFLVKRFRGSELGSVFRVLSRNPLSLIGGTIVLVFYLIAIIVAAAGDRVLPYNPNEVNSANILASPSLAHPMGTDSLGRDMLSRVIASIPIDASLSLVVIAASLLIGIILGSIAGYFGGIIDEVIMRLTDIILAFPGIVLTLAIASALGASLINMAIALILVWWSPYVRIARGVTLSVKENQYIEAARASGLGSLTIIRRHIIPNILSPMLVYASLDIGYIILTASVLSYLGVGVQPPQAEWGRMVFEMQSYLFSQWWLPIFPGLAITITVLGFNLLGDALRDILDPRTRKIVGG